MASHQYINQHFNYRLLLIIGYIYFTTVYRRGVSIYYPSANCLLKEISRYARMFLLKLLLNIVCLKIKELPILKLYTAPDKTILCHPTINVATLLT